MKKIFCLAAILAVNVILANGDDKVQSLGWIVGKMDTVQLRQFNCTPEVTNNGTNQFITFTTTTTGNDQTSKFHFDQKKLPPQSGSEICVRFMFILSLQKHKYMKQIEKLE